MASLAFIEVVIRIPERLHLEAGSLKSFVPFKICDY
jgi:hypothetical protein